jgi:hypothetical protein
MESWILDSIYEFQECCNDATVKLMRVMSPIHLHFNECPPESLDATVEDFMSFQSMSKENTSSSYSDRHFRHHKVMSHSTTLSLLHIESIDLAFCHGMLLNRWQKGVDVLLQEEQGNNL